VARKTTHCVFFVILLGAGESGKSTVVKQMRFVIYSDLDVVIQRVT